MVAPLVYIVGGIVVRVAARVLVKQAPKIVAKQVAKKTVTKAAKSTQSFTIVCRNYFDKLNIDFPNITFGKTAYPDIEDSIANLNIPIVYGDFATNLTPVNGFDGQAASVKSFVTNGINSGVLAGTSNLQMKTSLNALTFFDNTKVFLKRGDFFYLFSTSDITNISVDNTSFEIKQNGSGGITVIDSTVSPILYYKYEVSDEFYVRVRGKDLSGYNDNILVQAKDILLTYGGAVSGDFDSNWDTFKNKATPSESAIANIKSRVWIQESQPCIKYVLSMLEQVRLESFVNNELKLKISSLHFDNFIANPSFKITNFDIEKGSLKPRLDDKNNFNRLRGVFNFLPDFNENFGKTPIFRNQNAINASGKAISKQIVFPNLYIESDVINQVKEILKLSSSLIEIVDANFTWRSTLQDIGNFVSMNISIGAIKLSNVPMLIREIGYDPQGLKIPIRLWSFQLTPFSGWSGIGSGITGGTSSVITQE